MMQLRHKTKGTCVPDRVIAIICQAMKLDGLILI
jgi:hypothetical protein